jgi:hypothetical protein
MTAIDIYPLSTTIVCTLTGYRSSRTGWRLLREFKEAQKKENPKVLDYVLAHDLDPLSVIETIKRKHGIVLFLPAHLKK